MAGRPPRRFVAIAAAAVAALAGSATPAAADATWSPTLAISPPGSYSQHAQDAAANARGDAVVAWWREGAVGYARRSAGGAFGPPQALIERFGSDPRVAINSRGDAAIVWEEGWGAKGAILQPGSAPVRFDLASGQEDCSTSDIDVGIDDSGRVTAFWTDCKNIWHASRPQGGGFDKPRAIPNPGRWSSFMDASVAASGTAVVTWSDYPTVYAATAGAGGAFTTTVLASDSDPAALYRDPALGVAGAPLVSTNARGDAALSWVQFRWPSYVVMATTRPAGQSFRRPEVLQDFNPMGGGGVDIDPQGRASVAWSGSATVDGQYYDGVWVSSSTATGWEQPAVASTADACHADVASDLTGAVHVVWNTFSSGCIGDTAHMLAATRPAGSTRFEPTQLLATMRSEPERSGALFPPVVVAQGARGALATWFRGTLAPDYQQRFEFSETPSSAPARPFPPPEDPPSQDPPPGDGDGDGDGEGDSDGDPDQSDPGTGTGTDGTGDGGTGGTHGESAGSATTAADAGQSRGGEPLSDQRQPGGMTDGTAPASTRPAGLPALSRAGARGLAFRGVRSAYGRVRALRGSCRAPHGPRATCKLAWTRGRGSYRATVHVAFARRGRALYLTWTIRPQRRGDRWRAVKPVRGAQRFG
jgi:hypothetical protein